MIDYRNSLVKFYCSEYDLYIDILDNVIQKMKYHIENESNLEAGGFLTGYKVKDKNCIVIDDLSIPEKDDFRSKFSFIRKSKMHIKKMLRIKEKQSFCIGNWHTHPFASIPHPSTIDINTWKSELHECRSSFGYQIFIICANKGFKIWIGKENQNDFYQLFECEQENGIYKRR